MRLTRRKFIKRFAGLISLSPLAALWAPSPKPSVPDPAIKVTRRYGPEKGWHEGPIAGINDQEAKAIGIIGPGPIVFNNKEFGIVAIRSKAQRELNKHRSKVLKLL